MHPENLGMGAGRTQVFTEEGNVSEDKPMEGTFGGRFKSRLMMALMRARERDEVVKHYSGS